MTAASPPAAPARPVVGNLLCVASMLVWSFGLVAGEVLIPLVPPLELAALRAVTAAMVLIPAWWLIEGFAALRRANWGRALVVGGLGIGLGAYLIVVAQARTDAVTVAVISAMMPVVGILLEVLLDGRRMTRAMASGLGLSVAGALLALDWTQGGLALGLGALAAVASVVAFTWASRATVTAFPDLTDLGRTSVTITGAAILAVAGALAGRMFGLPATPFQAFGWREAGALLAFGTGSLAIAQTLFIMGVARLGIGIAGMHMNASSFYVMLIVFLSGGLWDWQRAGGAAVVVLGVLVAQGAFGARR